MIVGLSGVVAGVPLERLDTPVPFTFTARTRIGYVTPFERPVMRRGLETDAGLRVVQVTPSSIEYWRFETWAPPLLPRANATSTSSLPGVTEMIAGIEGTVEGVPFDPVDAVPGPRPLTARILTV